MGIKEITFCDICKKDAPIVDTVIIPTHRKTPFYKELVFEPRFVRHNNDLHLCEECFLDNMILHTEPVCEVVEGEL